MSPDEQERLYVALGHNRGDFHPDAPANRELVDRHLLWCVDQRQRGWLLPGRPPMDNLTIFATTSRAELVRALDADPLVTAGIRRYAVSGCQSSGVDPITSGAFPGVPAWAPGEGQGSHRLRS